MYSVEAVFNDCRGNENRPTESPSNPSRRTTILPYYRLLANEARESSRPRRRCPPRVASISPKFVAPLRVPAEGPRGEARSRPSRKFQKISPSRAGEVATGTDNVGKRTRAASEPASATGINDERESGPTAIEFAASVAYAINLRETRNRRVVRKPPAQCDYSRFEGKKEEAINGLDLPPRG